MLKGNRIILPSDVAKQIIKHWLRVIIIALVIAIGIGGYSFWNDRRKVASQNELNNKAKEYNIEDFTEEELNQAQNAVDAYNILVKTQNYYDNSYIQKVDPFAVHRIVLFYRIDMNMAKLPENLVGQEGNLAAALRTEYNYYVSRGDLGTDVAAKLGIDPQYITELISVENEGNVGFNVIVNGSDQIPNFIETVKTVLDEHRVELEKEKNAHILVINNEYESVLRIDDYYNRQKNSTYEINTCTNNLNNFLNKMSMEQVAFYNDKTGNDFKYINQETGEEDEVYESIGNKGLIKRGIIGVVLGVAVACVIELFIFMYSKKIVSESDYTVSLGMVLLGSDKGDEEKKVVVSKIKNNCLQNGIKEIVLASTQKEILDKDIVKKIEENLESNGVKVIKVFDFVSNSEQVDKVLGTNNLVLLEGMDKSLLYKVNEEAEFCEDCNINLLGVVNCAKE